MFSTSTHKKDWLFKSEDGIVQRRKESVEKFIARQQVYLYILKILELFSF